MADIGIQEKKAGIWPWVLVALVAALLLWWFLSRGDDIDDTAVVTDGGVAVAPMVTDTFGATGGAAAGGAVAAFMAHVQRTADGSMGLDHQYTATGLSLMADAMREVQGSSAPGAGQDLASQLDILRAQADSLQRNPQSTAHARLASEGMLTGATALDMLQRDRASAAEHVARVRASAQAVKPGPVLLEQRQHVKDYFDHAAAALRAITGQAT